MSAETGYVRFVLDRDDCQMMAQGLRVFARQLLDDCRSDMRGQAIPAVVPAQAQRLEAMAATLAGIDGMDCSWEGVIAAIERGGDHPAFKLTPDDWRAVSAAMAFLAGKVQAAEDRANGERLKELAGKADGIAGWCAGWLDMLHGLGESRGRAGLAGKRVNLRPEPETPGRE